MGAMSLGSRVGVVVCALALVIGLGAHVNAATSTVLRLAAPAAYADQDTTLTLSLTDEEGAPLAGAPVLLERRTGGSWRAVGTLTTGDDGRASADLTVSRVPADNTVRASYAGDADHAPVVEQGDLPLTPRASRVSLDGPTKVVDERSVTLRVRWRAGNEQPVAGQVRIFRQVPGGRWTSYAVVRTGADGRGTLRVTPRTDTRWQARAPRLSWVSADRSGVLQIDNRPPGRPVVLP